MAASRCAKVLDSYATRIGSKTWASAMAEESLSELRCAIASTASMNKSVSCCRNDGRSSMNLLWLDGSRSSFDPDGAAPLNLQSARKPLEVPDWIRVASLVAQAAGLAHDFGKYSEKFQLKLRGKAEPADGVRHEWISTKLFQSLRASEELDLPENWFKSWESLRRHIKESSFGGRVIANGGSAPATALETVDFVIASHHGLLDDPFSPISLNGSCRLFKKNWQSDPRLFAAYKSQFPEHACRKLKSVLERLDALEQRQAAGTSDPSLYCRAVLTYARTALILADHCVSAIKAHSYTEIPAAAGCKKPKSVTRAAYANTCLGAEGSMVLNQGLEWHLERVSDLAADTVWRMARLATNADTSLPGLEPFAIEKIRNCLPSADPRFSWQDKAAVKLGQVAAKSGGAPVLVFDLAGTGCGKTRMNMRAACILAKQASPRITVALNLRTLTLQTGKALQEQLGQDSNDMATVIGDGATALLFRKMRELDDGAESEEPERKYDAEGGIWPLPGWIDEFFTEGREKKIIGAPLLVSTIDFIIAAGEPASQGHHVKALLRLMSSDLIIDEIDSYASGALVAVLRLIQLSAFFGRNVICSSATLPKCIASAAEAAFASGVRMRMALGEGHSSCGSANPAYAKAYIDNLTPPEAFFIGSIPATDDGSYAKHLDRMISAIAGSVPLRIAAPAIVNTPSTECWLKAVADAAMKLHRDNNVADPKTRIRVSFGLVRVANISHAGTTADFLAKALPGSRVACYHANDWLIERFNKEKRLDYLLSRQHGDGHIFNDPEIRAMIDEAAGQGENDLPFIVVATPVEETGRDHDFDWAVIDASSAQSIVQAAGRVNRHRSMKISSPNIMIPNFNFRHCANCGTGKPRKEAFIWPGFEKRGDSLHGEHDLLKLLPWRQGQEGSFLPIDASLRFAGGNSAKSGETKSLAANDENAVACELGKYFSFSGNSCFTALPVPAKLMAVRVYYETPLRCRNGAEDLLRIFFEDPYGASPVVKRLMPVKGYPQWRWSNPGLLVTPEVPRKNTWLSLTPQEMRDLCCEAGLPEEQGLAARLTTYGKQDPVLAWMVDRDFGIFRYDR